MRIGYPCQNLSIGCTSARTFRLASYSRERLVETVSANIACLERILQFNLENRILFFRITSDLVPFASHPICRVRWQRMFASEFARIGRFIKRNGMRVSVHPDQFTLINSRKLDIFRRSVRELVYHARLLDLMGLGLEAKLQIHVGGVYGDKAASMSRFIERFKELPVEVRRRLAVENDDVSYTLADCLEIHRATGVPVIFDVFHHSLNSSGESLRRGVELAASTWKRRDGALIVDYSEQQGGARRGSHAQSIDVGRFRRFLAETRTVDFDVMLEIKDKERSALKAMMTARGLDLDFQWTGRGLSAIHKS